MDALYVFGCSKKLIFLQNNGIFYQLSKIIVINNKQDNVIKAKASEIRGFCINSSSIAF